jgi:hypothetical protein
MAASIFTQNSNGEMPLVIAFCVAKDFVWFGLVTVM